MKEVIDIKYICDTYTNLCGGELMVSFDDGTSKLINHVCYPSDSNIESDCEWEFNESILIDHGITLKDYGKIIDYFEYNIPNPHCGGCE